MAKKKPKKPSLEDLKSSLEVAILYARSCEDEAGMCEEELRDAESAAEDAWDAVDKIKLQIEEMENERL